MFCRVSFCLPVLKVTVLSFGEQALIMWNVTFTSLREVFELFYCWFLQFLASLFLALMICIWDLLSCLGPLILSLLLSSLLSWLLGGFPQLYFPTLECLIFPKHRYVVNFQQLLCFLNVSFLYLTKNMFLFTRSSICLSEMLKIVFFFLNSFFPSSILSS